MMVFVTTARSRRSRMMLAARRRRRERVAATEFKAKVAPYLVEAPEL